MEAVMSVRGLKADPTGDFVGFERRDPAALDELLTVDEVAALLKVPRSWVYEHTRTRQDGAVDRLPFIKIGKYVRFEPCAVAAFLARRSRTA
jgi:excisionase family DNA binding protein